MASTQRVALTCTLTYLNGSNISPVANQQVTVVKRNGGGPATIYNAPTGGSSVSTVTTDSSGNLNGSVNSYWIVEGSYVIQVPGSGSYNAFNVYFEAVHGDGVGNLDPSVGSLTGDASGTLPNVVINTIGGQTPVTDSTTLGGVLSGTLPNPSFSALALSQLIPSGTIIEHAGAIAPSGYMLANGQPVSRTNSSYTNLLAAITTSKSMSFGSGTTSITISDQTLLAFFQGVLGASSLTTNQVYPVMVPISGSGLSSNNGINTITSVEFTGSSTILTLGSYTSAPGTNVSVLIAPHGVGDGSTTFNLPNRQGQVGIGAGTFSNTNISGQTTTNTYSLGSKVGEYNHQILATEMPSHVHNADHGHGINWVDYGHYHSFSGTTDNGDGARDSNGLYFWPGNVPWSDANIQYYGVASGTAHTVPGSAGWGGADDSWWTLSHYHNFNGTTTSNNSGIGDGFGNPHPTIQNTSGFNTQAAGSGAQHNVVQPSVVLNYFVKL